MGNNFRWTSWYHWVLVVGGIGTLAVGAFAPEVIPYGYLGLIGNFLHYINYANPPLLRLAFTMTVAVHLIEGIYAFILTRRMKLDIEETILWTSQTTILGLSSTLSLYALYKQQQASKKD